MKGEGHSRRRQRRAADVLLNLLFRLLMEAYRLRTHKIYVCDPTLPTTQLRSGLVGRTPELRGIDGLVNKSQGKARTIDGSCQIVNEF